MPQFRFKIKGYLNETGEYSALHTADSGTILQFIIQHWFNETLPNNLDIVFIQNDAGDQLVIDHLKRDIFDYYFIEKKESKKYYSKKTDIQFMFFALESFFNNRNEDLKHNLSYSFDDWKFVRGDYSGKDFRYKVTNFRVYKQLEALILPLIVVVLGFAAAIFISWIILVIAFVFIAVVLPTTYSTITRTRSYLDDNKDLVVKFSRGDDYIHVQKGSFSRSIPKTDIRSIVKYIQPLNDSRSITDFHTEIEFLNGNVLNLTSLLIAQDEIEGKFSNDLIAIEYKTVMVKKLPRATNLDKYLSAIKPTGDPLPVRI